MPEFTVHNRETAPEKSKPTFDEIEKTWGMVPNVFKVMAESPALMKGCWALETIFVACILGLFLGLATAAVTRSWTLPFGFGPAIASGALAVLVSPVHFLVWA